MHDSARTATFRITGSREGFAEAREFTHRTLDRWDVGECADDAVTVVTELAANAVLHALPDVPPGGADVRLRLTLRRAHLVCAVSDQCDTPPVYPSPGESLLEHGRGLHIVEALSAHWGWTRCAPLGKTVWAMLPTRVQA